MFNTVNSNFYLTGQAVSISYKPLELVYSFIINKETKYSTDED